MKKLIVLALVLGLCGAAWADSTIQFTSSMYQPEPTGSLQVEPNDDIVNIFDDNDVDAKYLKMVRDFEFVPASVSEDIETVVKDDTDSVLGKIRDQLKSHLVAGKIEYVYMLIGNRLFSATLGEPRK